MRRFTGRRGESREDGVEDAGDVAFEAVVFAPVEGGGVLLEFCGVDFGGDEEDFEGGERHFFAEEFSQARRLPPPGPTGMYL